MKTNLINIKESEFTYEIISTLPLTQIYYECDKGVVNTCSKDDVSSIYLNEVSSIINKMISLMEQNIDLTTAFQKAIFDDTRLEILEDYAQGFINQQQLSDYLRDSHKDEDLTKGIQINDVYIR